MRSVGWLIAVPLVAICLLVATLGLASHPRALFEPMQATGPRHDTGPGTTPVPSPGTSAGPVIPVPAGCLAGIPSRGTIGIPPRVLDVSASLHVQHTRDADLDPTKASTLLALAPALSAPIDMEAVQNVTETWVEACELQGIRNGSRDVTFVSVRHRNVSVSPDLALTVLALRAWGTTDLADILTVNESFSTRLVEHVRASDPGPLIGDVYDALMGGEWVRKPDGEPERWAVP